MVNDFVDDFSGYVDCVFVVLAKSMMLGLWEGAEQEGLTMAVHGKRELKKHGRVGETTFIPPPLAGPGALWYEGETKGNAGALIRKMRRCLEVVRGQVVHVVVDPIF